MRTLIFFLTCLPLCFASAADAQVKVTGERRVGSAITLDITGPKMSEMGDPNPFRDVISWVVFRQGKMIVNVPVYFAADGDAGQTGSAKGGAWRCHFVPDTAGRWEYDVLRYEGRDAAWKGVPLGVTIGPVASGSIEIAANPEARGMLRGVGERYLRFDSGERFIKAGVDSPENFLAFADFDGTYRKPGKKVKGLGTKLHAYAPHVKDWREGDPTWRGGKGKGIIGAVNYLAEVGVNSIYMITMNVGGDGQDVWPWLSEKNEHRDRFDCSKLDQWNIMFEHMSRRGVMLHLLLQETENDQLLDNGNLGDKRKMYLREMIARFAHHPMLVWNLGEENTQTTIQQKAMADYIREHDPYGHAIVIHTYPNQHEKVYKPLLGHKSIDGLSLQTNKDVTGIHRLTKDWIARSTKAGHPWAVFIDEPGDASVGTTPDGPGNNHDSQLRHALWGNLMAGGSGVEWYFGYKNPHNDLNLEDFRSRDLLFKRTAAAVKLFNSLPFHEMEPAPESIEGDRVWCLAKKGQVYLLYAHPNAEATLRLPDGQYTRTLYDPNTAKPILLPEAVQVFRGERRIRGGESGSVVVVTRLNGQ